jgi:PiT family inorganic phosphate transporter
MYIVILITAAALWLAYSNGANDNFKGVATLYGSDTLSYKGALWWATATTFAGSIVSIFAAHKLIAAFSGKGLVPDAIAGSPTFAAAVGCGAAVTIFVATYIGMPTSTTHALIGGLLGTGLAANATIHTGALITKFAIPMLTSPLLAIAIASILYVILRGLRRKLGVTKETCICLADGSLQPVQLGGEQTAALAAPQLEVTVGETANCVQRYRGSVVGIDTQSSLNVMHYLSAGAVCFSRAVNDTPKIAALLLTTAAISPTVGIAVIGVAIVVGGLIQSRRVAETMSKRITELNTGQGFTANITTAALVLFASNLGVPVSTTHVSCGSIFGIGMANRSCQWKTTRGILATWITTLPAAAVLSGLLYLVLDSIIG